MCPLKQLLTAILTTILVGFLLSNWLSVQPGLIPNANIQDGRVPQFRLSGFPWVCSGSLYRIGNAPICANWGNLNLSCHSLLSFYIYLCLTHSLQFHCHMWQSLPTYRCVYLPASYHLCCYHDSAVNRKIMVIFNG